MARVTVEDCLLNVENRFELVAKASKRARSIAMGADPLVEWENDKPTVVALREIAAGLEPLEPKTDEEMLMEAFGESMEEASEESEETAKTEETPTKVAEESTGE